MYRYETHMHTSPVSKCARASVRESVEFYADLGYDGIFITNHFLDANISWDRSLPYEEQIALYCNDFYEAQKCGSELGIKVFFGVEMTQGGTDFLVYGLPPEWYAAHPEIMGMKKSEELPFLQEQGATVFQAHPFREAFYIDHIRLFPRCIQGVEVINANRTEFENHMAQVFAEEYGLQRIAGSDNHTAAAQKMLAGVEFEHPISSEAEFLTKLAAGEGRLFLEPNPKQTEESK